MTNKISPKNSVFSLKCVSKIWQVERDGIMWFESEFEWAARQALRILEHDEDATDELNLVEEQYLHLFPERVSTV